MTDIVGIIGDEVERLVRTYPDAIYDAVERCSYVEGTAGEGKGCVFGQAMVNTHIATEDQLRDFECCGNMVAISPLMRRMFDVDVPRWWEYFQKLQDVKIPWGTAFYMTHTYAQAYDTISSVAKIVARPTKKGEVGLEIRVHSIYLYNESGSRTLNYYNGQSITTQAVMDALADLGLDIEGER